MQGDRSMQYIVFLSVTIRSSQGRLKIDKSETQIDQYQSLLQGDWKLIYVNTAEAIDDFGTGLGLRPPYVISQNVFMNQF